MKRELGREKAGYRISVLVEYPTFPFGEMLIFLSSSRYFEREAGLSHCADTQGRTVVAMTLEAEGQSGGEEEIGRVWSQDKAILPQ